MSSARGFFNRLTRYKILRTRTIRVTSLLEA
jgi:hypothetical protein